MRSISLSSAFVLLFLIHSQSTDGVPRTKPRRTNWKTTEVSPKFNFQYPDVNRDPSVVDDYFGTKVHDYYRWLEDPDSPETVAFVKAQNNLTVPYLEKAKGRDVIRKRLETILDYTKYGVPTKRRDRYFSFKKTGLQNQAVLYVQTGLNGEPKVLVDPNTLAQDGTVAITETSPSWDGEIYAYSLSSKGSDWVTVHFKNVSSGKNLEDVLRHTKWPGVEWNKENTGIFYSAYPKPNGTADGSETTANENMKIFFHRIGTDQEDDIVIVEFPEFPKRVLGGELSEDGKYFIVAATEGSLTNQIYYTEMKPIINLRYALAKPKLIPLFVKDDAKYSYLTSSTEGEIMYIRTNKDAPNFRIIGVYLDNPDESYWSTLLPENPRDVLSWAAPINNHNLVTCYIRDVKSALEVRRLRDGSLIKAIDIGVGTVSGYTGKRQHTTFFYSVTSFLYSGKIFSVDLSKKVIEPVLYRESIVPDFNDTSYIAKQIFYKSKDGTNVPMFIIHQKNLELDGKAPTLLYGYGGFDISLQPAFSEVRLAFIQLFNGVVAIPNIRGGGEYGAKWHNGGRLLNKQNSFDDFQAAAEYLIENNYTSPKKLVIQGGSNGGLLVGACVNQRPELLGAAIAEVGVLDMLRYQKFTIGYAWASDYGTSDNETHFNNLIKFSPLHNIRLPKDDRIQYPGVLVLTGDHDDRVVPLHSLKFISELQYTVGRSLQQKNPLLILIETDAGHGAGKPTWKRIKEAVNIFSFLVQTLKLNISKTACDCVF